MRAARATLLALGATVSIDTGCGSASYGGMCRPDACATPQQDATNDAFQFVVDAPSLGDAADDVTDAQPTDVSADVHAGEADADAAAD